MDEFKITGKSTMILHHNQGDNKSTLKSTSIFLEVDGKCDPKTFYEKDALTKHGVKTLTQALVQGLVANIHAGHQQGKWNDAEHLRYIIAELERGFVQIGTIKPIKKDE